MIFLKIPNIIHKKGKLCFCKGKIKAVLHLLPTDKMNLIKDKTFPFSEKKSVNNT